MRDKLFTLNVGEGSLNIIHAIINANGDISLMDSSGGVSVVTVYDAAKMVSVLRALIAESSEHLRLLSAPNEPVFTPLSRAVS